MRKSLFTKYFLICASLVLVAVIIIGTVVIYFSTAYLKSEKVQILSDNTDRAISFYGSVYNDFFNNETSMEYMKTAFNSLSFASGSVMFLTDTNGKVILSSEGEGESYLKKSINQSTISLLDVAPISDISDLEGFFNQPYHIYAKAVNKDSAIVGYIFSCSLADSINVFFIEIVKIFTLTAIVVLAALCVILLAVTKHMNKPIKQLTTAMTSFTHGDYTARVPENFVSEETHTLSVSFNNMADAIANSEATHKAFVGNISHELRTPMTTIGGFVDGILDGTIPTDKQNQYLEVVSKETKRLTRLVKSMLNISKFESGKLTINKSTFNISSLLFEVLVTFEKNISEKNFEIKGLKNLSECFVFADRDLIFQVVYNIIENATKFTPENGWIEIEVSEIRDSVEVSITNSGEGVSPEDLPHIFDRFYKTDRSRSKDRNGAGLGLYLTKKIVNIHGGDIYVASEVSKYTRFTFNLDLATKSQRSALQSR